MDTQHIRAKANNVSMFGLQATRTKNWQRWLDLTKNP